MKQGLYEQVMIKSLQGIDEDSFQVQKEKIDKETLPGILAKHFSRVLEDGLKNLKQSKASEEEQIDFCNYLIQQIGDTVGDVEGHYDNQKVSKDAELLLSIISKRNTIQVSKPNYPTRTNYSIAEPFIFTGANTDSQFLTELKKEIESSDEIDFIVSFIKWSGIRLLLNDLKAFTDSGKKLRIITTTYIGATEAKAIEELAKLRNTEIKISYETKTTRLHAKSYIFKRDTGFSTAYVGSSNISSAALTGGTEWNVKVVEKEMKDVFNKICGTFEVYWASEDFETYNEDEPSKLRDKLLFERYPRKYEDKQFYDFEIHPYSYQQRVLDNLEAERENRGNFRNLVVAATGTGKTVMSAFDFKRFIAKSDKKVNFLFIAHREEILRQSIGCFRAVLKDHNFGELMVGGLAPSNINNLFISIQTLNSRELWNTVDKDYYDYIIIDEFHHAAAESYQKVLDYFEPTILLGLTATPERMDGKNILKYFNNRISAEIRLPEAINRNLLVPFSYFGVSDDTDLSELKWTRGGYDRNQLSNLFSHNSVRASLIVDSIDKYLNDIEGVKGLGFCVSKQHAEYMSDVFNEAGISSIFLTSDSQRDVRESAKQKLVSGEVKFIFVVDLYNEGVDIPEINTVLFLRPTESLTIFLQQLGRGLRLSKGKDSLTVLDYVGQANKNYRFADKYNALLSGTAGELSNEIKLGFPHLPKGCYIQLERKAQDYILHNIQKSFDNKVRFTERFNEFENESGLGMSYENFFNYHNIHPAKMYKLNLSYTFLYINLIGVEFIEDDKYAKFLGRLSISKSTNFSKTLLELLPIIKENDIVEINELENKMLLMLHYTMWQKTPKELGFNSVIDSIREIVNSSYYEEIVSLLRFNLDKIDIVNKPLNELSNNPLELHSTYSRDQIMAAFNVCNEDRYFSLREGVWYSEESKTDLFFVTLNKLEKHYASEVKYNDYSINDEYFHWQSQNTTSEKSNTGQRYINHKMNGSKILLCVRDNRVNEYGQTENYTILGYADYVSHKHERPISIIWRLHNKIPGKFIETTSKLMVN